MSVPDEKTEPKLSPRPKLRSDVRVRQEWFGALAFDQESCTYYEINKSALNLLSLIDGTRTTDAVQLAARERLDIDDRDVKEFLDSLRGYRLLE